MNPMDLKSIITTSIKDLWRARIGDFNFSLL